MPRIPRGQTQGGIYHIINRGNMRMQVFDDEDDYEFFLKLLKTGLEIIIGVSVRFPHLTGHHFNKLYPCSF